LLRLSRRAYLCGREITEADWRLFATLVRFDPVYVGHFKCNIRRISDYPNLWAYTRKLFQWPGVREESSEKGNAIRSRKLSK
jgi:putative glutathione S-transferase